MKTLPLAGLIVCALCIANVQGASMYFSLPPINGADPTPGYPGAMNLRSITIGPDEFSITKNADAATTQITTAIADATVFPAGTALLYNSTPTGAPDATVTFSHVVVPE